MGRGESAISAGRWLRVLIQFTAVAPLFALPFGVGIKFIWEDLQCPKHFGMP